MFYKNRNIIIALAALVLVVALIFAFMQYRKKPSFGDEYINRVSFQESIKTQSGTSDDIVRTEAQKELQKLKNEIAKFATGSIEFKEADAKIKDLEKRIQEIQKKEKEKEKRYNDIKSFTRAICSFYKTSHIDAVKSKYFKGLRTKVKDALASASSANDFLYIDLPEIVYSNCSAGNDLYKEKILIYLQSEQDIDLKIDENYDAIHKKFIEGIMFVTGDTDENLLKNNKAYFEKYFFNTQIVPLLSIYYPYHMRERASVENFYNNPIGTLEEGSRYSEMALTVFQNNLKKVGIKSLDEFRALIKNHYNIVDNKEHAASIMRKYDNLIALSKQEWVEVEKGITKLDDFQKFLLSKDYKKMLDSPSLSNALDELWKDTLLLTILSNDYADGINKVWYGEQVFGNKEKGNNIFRLNFVYLLSKQ